MDKGKLVINGFSKKGLCNLPKEQFYSALFAPEIVMNGGIKVFLSFRLRSLCGRKVYILE